MPGPAVGATKNGIRMGMALLLAAIGLPLFLLFSQGAYSQTSTPVPDRPPLGDCYGGLLTHSPIHCYALEQAEAAGDIEVEAIYLAGKRLYVYVGGEVREDVELGSITSGWSASASSETHVDIGRHMAEYARLWPDRAEVGGWAWNSHFCREENQIECLLKIIGNGANTIESYLDHEIGYDSFFLMGGRADSRRSHEAWRSWTQVWPRGVVGQGGMIPDKFDVSDVDVANFPEFDCSSTMHEWACIVWKHNLDMGISGVVGAFGNVQHLRNAAYSVGTTFVQLKYDPKNPEAFEAAKTAILNAEGNDPDYLVFFPVEHSLPDLWKWSIILDRFADSQSNTIGILSARLFHNSPPQAHLHLEGNALYPPDGPGAPGLNDLGFEDNSTLRETVIIFALDPRVVMDALPVLLPQLGIPSSAVGAIYKRDQKREYLWYADDPPNADESGDSADSEAVVDDTEADTDSVTMSKAPDAETNATGLTPKSKSAPADTDAESSSNTLEAEPSNEHASTQGDAVEADELNAPPVEISSTEGLSAWLLAVIVAGSVALLLASGLAARRRLSRRRL